MNDRALASKSSSTHRMRVPAIVVLTTSVVLVVHDSKAQDASGPAKPSPTNGTIAPAPPKREPSRAADSRAAVEPSEAELARVEALVEHYDSGFSSYRLWGGISLLAAGAITLPMVTIVRKDADVRSSPIQVVAAGLAGGELAGGLALLFWGGSDFGRLSESIAEQRAAGRTSAEILAAVESDWKKKAEHARTVRHVAGVVGASIGVIAIGGGTYMALKDVNGLSDDDRFGFSAALLGIGGVSLIFATRSLFFEDPIEVAWRSRHSSGSPSASSLPFRHFAFTPMHSGGGISFRAVF